MADKNTLLLVDGSSFLYRAYYAAHGGFSTSKGVPTGACLIIARMFQNLIKEYGDGKIIVVFDAKGKSFRNDMLESYKANRPPMPDDLKVQVLYVHKIVKALGLPLVSIEGVEADDVIGSYVTQAKDTNLHVVIATGDKDLAQFVSDKVTIFDSMNNEIITSESVFKKFGVPPHLIVDFLAIKGDKVDNIPGMPGAGDVTATSLLNNLGGIYDIYKRRDEIQSLSFRGAKTFAKKYEDNFAQVELSYKLATIKTDVPLPLSIDDIKSPSMDKYALIEIYNELEFKKLVEALEGDLHKTSTRDSVDEDVKLSQKLASSFKSEKPNFNSIIKTFDSKAVDLLYKLENGLKLVLVQSKDDLLDLAQKIKDKGFCVLDTETTSLRAMDATLVGISLCVSDDEAFYIPVAHNVCITEGYSNIDKDTLLAVLNPIFKDMSIKKIGHNIKYDLIVLKNAGFEIENVYFDTLIAFHALKSSLRLSMDDLALSFLNYKTISYEDVCGKGAKAITFDNVPLDKALNYAAEDAYITYLLYKEALDLFAKDSDAKKFFFDIEMPLLTVLYHMEYSGTLVSGIDLYNQTLKLNDIMLDTQKQIYKLCGHEFNIASPKQLSEVLFVKLAIPYPKKPKKGKDGQNTYSTSEDILSALAPNYDIASLVLRFRTVSKLISTYTDKLPNLISDKTGRIHTSFNQAGTVTGRLSSSDPNLQNIPARTDEGRLIRTAFCAPKGYKIIAADYSQIELRLIAHLSEDPNLIKAFVKHADIHKATAAEVLGIPLDAVTPSLRSQAKATNFGLMYGMSAHGLAAQTGMAFKEAKAYIEKYFLKYQRVKEYMKSIIDNAKACGYIQTLMGNKVYFDALNSDNAIARSGAERAAINAPMQGSAADIIKLAMIEIDKWICSLDDKNKIVMTMQVHDELVFEVRDDFIDEAKAKIKEIMESVVDLKVPLEVGIGVASNWGDAH